MANNKGAIGVLIFLVGALITTVLILWWLEWSRRSNPYSKQSNVVITKQQPLQTIEKTIILINPTKNTGKLIIDGRSSLLLIGRNTIQVENNNTNIQWQLGNGPIRVASNVSTKGKEVYVLLNDGLFKKSEWNKSIPIKVIPLPTSAADVIMTFQSGYTITPATSSQSSVSITDKSIENVYTGLPLRIVFNTNNSSGNSTQTITTTIISTTDPLIIFQSLKILGKAGGVIELHATQDPVTITLISNVPTYIQVSEAPGVAGKIYKIYPGTNYFDASDPENKWLQLVSQHDRSRSMWMPLDNYRTNGEIFMS